EVDGDSVQSVSGGGHWGGGLVISTRDHARFGLLMLREGVWGDDRLLSKEWIDQALTPSIQANYGFMWWLNTEREQFSNAPESSFFALGAGSTSTIWVDPDHDIVLVSRWVDGPDVNELIGRILAAYDGGAPAEGVRGAPLGEGFDAAEGFAVGFGPSFKRVFSDEPTGFGGHYDDRVEIELARNEVEGTQMILFPTEDVAGVAVRVEPLAGPGDAVISSEDIEIRTVGYVNLIESRSAGGRVGWHPDPLFPNQPVDLKRGVPQSFLVSVRTEVDTPPGDYFGALVIEAAGRSVRRELAVRVWDVVLPETPRFKTANFADWRLPGRMWPVSQGYPELDDEARLSHMLRLADLGFEYRLPPTVFLANGLSSWNEGGRGETTYGFPTHDDDGAGGQVFNPDRTDRLIDYMLERGANHFFLAVTSNVWRHSPDGGRRDRLVAYLNDYRDHLRARGLLDLAYVYNIDEPWNEAVREAKQTYTLIRERVGPDLRVMQNTNQNNPRIVPQLLGFFDVLDINLGFHDVTDVAAYRSLHPGPLGELWWNVNRWPDTHPNLFVEYPLMDARIIGPLSYAYDIDGFEYWGMVWVDGIGNYRPVASDELRVPWEVDAHSLDGTLVYPAEDGEIYPSLRLASLRDGFEDLELLYVLESLNPEHPLLEVPIVQELDRFTRDPAEYLRFRRRVAEAIVATTPDPLRP
ncbi:MAG: glycoside hydrolase domain-containing protein, partial [Gemmatimonadota bacterium]